MPIKKTRSVSFLLTALVYVVALIAAFLILYFLNDIHLLLSTFIADIVATVVVWLFGILLKNSSVYDPYWSVIPIFIALFWIIYKGDGFSIVDILFLAAFFIWGTRLTVNWVKRWEGLDHQDWRYTMLKNKSPRFWFFTNLFGINLIPTLIVFACMIPVYYGVLQGSSYNALSFIGFIICVGAVAVQSLSDRQMDHFRSNCDPGENIDEGFWKYSRHPNYFGEVLFWWGIYLISLSVTMQMWFMIIGPIAMTLLFMFISIPMMEDHIMSSRPGYSEYKNKVSMIIPWARKQVKEKKPLDIS